MNLCVATTSIPGDLTGKLEAVAEAGFSAIELHEPDFTVFEGGAQAVRKQCESLGLSIVMLQPFRNLEGQENRQHCFERLEAKFDLMQSLGTELLLVTAADQLADNVEDSHFVDDLGNAAERAKKRGLRIAYMALPWSLQITTDSQAANLIAQVNHSNLGLALNSYFSLAGGRRPAELRNIEVDKLFHVQLSDAPKNNVDLRMLKRHFGLLPGLGQLNLEGFVKVLARSGYQGFWSIARLGEQSEQASAKQLTGDAFCALVTLLDKVAQTLPELKQPVNHLPPRVRANGFEFIEFTVNAASKAMLVALLSAMCFRRERQHLSKSVELWRQGAINILVNSEKNSFAHKRFLEYGPGVCDMGLRVDNAQKTVARANALGTAPFTQSVRTGELQIPAIHGVGGSVVHFIDQQSDLHRIWDIDFEAVAKTKAIPPAGLRRIDHVAQTMTQEAMQSWLLYYLSTFDMYKSEIVNISDPAGIIRSQALETPEGEVRMNLNGTKNRETFAGSFLGDALAAGVQHIALLTDDIFETSKILKRVGFPRLEIPANYYDDLGLRYDLEYATLATMQEDAILYERDGKSEYFQIYSKPIFNGFFFEIVQRSSGYSGYGASNASVRLAAQRRYILPASATNATNATNATAQAEGCVP